MDACVRAGVRTDGWKPSLDRLSSHNSHTVSLPDHDRRTDERVHLNRSSEDIPPYTSSASMPNERTPLTGGNGTESNLPMHRPQSYPAAHSGSSSHDSPNFAKSMWWLLTSSWLNVLLLFVPLGFLAEKLHWGAAAVFGINFLAIVPLAKLLGDATEQASLKLGQTLGGLLNATFGNAVELIVGIVALTQGELRIVQTSLIGSILSNILLVLGMSFIAGGIYKDENVFRTTAAQASGSIMTLGCITVVLPAAYQGSLTLMKKGPHDDTEAGLLFISRGTSILLLVVYALYLIFQLRTHAFLFEAERDGEQEEEEEAKMTPVAAVVGLLAVTLVTSFSADYLVSAIDEVAQEYSIPKAFIGTILLPIVGNAAEHVTSVWMAAKDQLDLSLAVALGSSIQIAIGVIPSLVLVGWAIGQPLSLYFQSFETVVLVASVILVNTLIQDGRSNWIEGVLLLALYFVAALSFWVEP